MKIITGQDLLKVDWLDFKGVTTNATIKKDGCFVMGRGFAKQIRDALPGFDAEAGRAIIKSNRIAQTSGETPEYGILFLPPPLRYPGWFLFQVKRHFRDAADLDIIALSVKRLTELAHSPLKMGSRASDCYWGVNFPGIGYGRLREVDVIPLLIGLPDNVFIFKL